MDTKELLANLGKLTGDQRAAAIAAIKDVINSRRPKTTAKGGGTSGDIDMPVDPRLKKPEDKDVRKSDDDDDDDDKTDIDDPDKLLKGGDGSGSDGAPDNDKPDDSDDDGDGDNIDGAEPKAKKDKTGKKDSTDGADDESDEGGEEIGDMVDTGEEEPSKKSDDKPSKAGKSKKDSHSDKKDSEDGAEPDEDGDTWPEDSEDSSDDKSDSSDAGKKGKKSSKKDTTDTDGTDGDHSEEDGEESDTGKESGEKGKKSSKAKKSKSSGGRDDTHGDHTSTDDADNIDGIDDTDDESDDTDDVDDTIETEEPADDTDDVDDLDNIPDNSDSLDHTHKKVKDLETKEGKRTNRATRALRAAKTAIKKLEAAGKSTSDIKRAAGELEDIMHDKSRMDSMSDSAFNIAVNAVLDAIGNEVKINYDKDRASEVKAIEADFNDPFTADEIADDDAANDALDDIKARQRDTEAARKAAEKLGTGTSVGTIEQFSKDILFAASEDVEDEDEEEEDTWSRENRRWAGTGVAVKGVKTNDIDSSSKPVISVYIDQSGSWGDEEVRAALNAISSLNALVDNGSIVLAIKYFSKIYPTTNQRAARLEGSQECWGWILEDIKKMHAKNVVIVTDTDICYDYGTVGHRGCFNTEDTVMVQGHVWYIWKNEYAAKNAIRSACRKHLFGVMGTSDYILQA